MHKLYIVNPILFNSLLSIFLKHHSSKAYLANLSQDESLEEHIFGTTRFCFSISDLHLKKERKHIKIMHLTYAVNLQCVH